MNDSVIAHIGMYAAITELPGNCENIRYYVPLLRECHEIMKELRTEQCKPLISHIDLRPLNVIYLRTFRLQSIFYTLDLAYTR